MIPLHKIIDSLQKLEVHFDTVEVILMPLSMHYVRIDTMSVAHAWELCMATSGGT